MSFRNRLLRSVVFLLLVTSTLIGAGCGRQNGSEAGGVPNDKEADQPKNQQPTVFCPLDGEPLTKPPSWRPLAVMVGNTPEAWPVYGLADAEMVIEAPVEGGITRFQAYFYHRQADKIGTVRSTRTYFVRWAQGFGAVVAHAGQSPQAKEYLARNNVAHLDEIATTKGFWREKDRRAPHNLFASTDGLHDLAAQRGWTQWQTPLLAWPTLRADAPAGIPATEVTVRYPQAFNQVDYRYDQDKNLYYRFMGGAPQVDGTSGRQLSAANVLVWVVPSRVIDSYGRLELVTEGEGEALVFSGGRVYQGSWRKEKADDPVRTYLADGKAPVLVPGPVWVQVVSSANMVQY